VIVNNTFFSADWHLNHYNIMRYCNRPFSSVEEMDETILQNFYDTVKPGSVFYFLGDLTFNEDVAREFFENLPNSIHFHYIIGNHDKKSVIRLAERYCDYVGHMENIKIQGKKITLCHYAMRVWNCSHYGAWQFYAHSHTILEPIGKQSDVGVDKWNFYMPSFYMLKDAINNLENNMDLIKDQND